MTGLRYYIVLVLLITVFCCVSSEKSENKEKVKMRLSFKVIPEDYERNIYSIEWNDTLGQSEGYMKGELNWIKRPKEVWCIITNNNSDTLGYYQGLSTAQSFTYFQSTDSIISLNFLIGLNFFTDKLKDDVEKDTYMKLAQDYSKKHRLPIVFEPIDFNIKTELGREFELELQQE